MSCVSRRLLYWSPRVFTITFAIFLSLFALEAFNQFHGFWRVAAAFCMGLIPALMVLAVLAVAWRWEWVGAAAFAGLAVWYSWHSLGRHILSWPIFLGIPLPLLVIAGLFLASWVERANLHAAPHQPAHS